MAVTFFILEYSIFGVERLKFCLLLPPLGQLSCLKSLSVKGFGGVVMVGAEFYGHCDAPFECLETLSFEDMAEWEEWCCPREAFCVLQELCITNCPKLTESENLPCGLQKLGIYETNISDSTLEKMVQHCTHLEELSLYSSSNLRSLPQGSTCQPTTLKQLEIRDCKVLDYSKILLYTSLESLVIGDGRHERDSIPHPLEQFPLGTFPMLNCLSLIGFEDLKWIGASGLIRGPHQQQHRLPCLNSIFIDDCPNLIGKYSSGLISIQYLSATNMTSLRLSCCISLKSLPEQMQSLFPSLEDLTISECPEIESFPKEGCLPTKLKEFSIGRSDKLVTAMMRREWSLQTLSSLTQFKITGAEIEIVFST